MKILICDDSDNCKILGRSLLKLGHKPFTAENDQQAVEMFTSLQPDFVLLDPKNLKNGYETANKIRQSVHHPMWVPIIFMSSDISEDLVANAIKVGMDDLLLKPIEPAMLKAKIHTMQHYLEMHAKLVDCHNRLSEVDEKLISANQLLAELSLKDPLTRLANRRGFEETLKKYCGSAIRENEPLCLLMIEIDNFKSVNDTYGLQTGDYCLQRIAQVLKHGSHRSSDFPARYSGAEFAHLLANTPFAGGIHVAERLRLAVDTLQIQNKRAPLGIVTISVGLSCSKIDSEFASEALVAMAASALQEAKELGGNSVVGSKNLVDEKVSDNFLKFKKHAKRMSSQDTSSKGHY